jgi:sporulation protein YlmC with PRC-barrel domain
VTLQELLDKKVHTAEGDCLGRVYDFGGRWEGSDLLVTHLRVGPRAWIERLKLPAFFRTLLRAAPSLEIPWEAIASVEEEIHLEWDRHRCRQGLERMKDEG